ncbi:M16 family metallopeptidase [Tenacibaculum sp. IB213877]|uniref:M16 family metallopeptidase n=1 Tax=Tenacibaculum sp. IB213877 TaxID=3097351 RepID=UPI002A5A6DA7|nr:insulinase family protein [Tenacibaculum sp. IB213877]MDY0779977.1 insulinase family protein [Tenacibaculum sp. IB213877]
MKQILIVTLSVVSVFINTIKSQTLDLNSKLPIDTTIKKGVLANGLTYYIKNTDVVKGAASYYIIQNVGSILENKDQQGLAHFLEHMAFNGTQSFPGKGILNTLEKHGAVFGKDINAYTSFDETVYNLNNIPTKDGLVDTCLTILKDWSNYLLLTDNEIDAERGVIKEEWRTRQNGQARLYKASSPVTFNNSKYAKRMPIGLMSVVENFDYKTLRDFYHDWYRTDLQAIAIIGDINVEEIEAKIIENFSKIPAVKKPRKREVISIPNHKGLMYSLATDPEVSTSSISFGIRHKKPSELKNVAYLKDRLLEAMALNMLSSRISELSQNPESSFLGARVYYGDLSRTHNVFGLSINPKKNKQKEAFKETLTEIVRAVKFGYNQSEIDRMIINIQNSYENQIARLNDRSHGKIEQLILKNYLENKPITDVKKVYEIVKQLLSTITQEELKLTINKLYSKQNRFLNITGVKGEKNISKKQAEQIIKEVENNTKLSAYSETVKGKTLLSGVQIKAGKIQEEVENKNVNATTFTLSNGVKVHYKYANKNKNKVDLNALSYGGKSLLKNDDLPSANLVTGLVQMSGLANYSATDLRKVLAGKTANVEVKLNDIYESFIGESNTKDVETMLQIIHLYFTKPRFDQNAFEVLNNNLTNYLTRRSQNIREKMNDSLTVTLYGKNHPTKRLFNQEYVNDISFDKIKAIYKDRFSDASDFEFFIVGDIQKKELKPLLEKYIASLPTKQITEKYKDNSVNWIADNIDKDIYLKMEDPKASVNIVYQKEMPYSIKNTILTNALGSILQLRVTESVREKAGGAYSPKAYATFSREPKSIARINFNFDCNPDLVDKLTNAVRNELQKIADGKISNDDLKKIKTNFLKEREQSKDRNSYQMYLLTNFYRYGYNIDDPKNFESIVKNISLQDIQELTQQILNGAKTYKVVFKPE